jgi:hypothetical protein
MLKLAAVIPRSEIVVATSHEKAGGAKAAMLKANSGNLLSPMSIDI